MNTPCISLGTLPEIKMPSASHSDHDDIEVSTAEKGEGQIAQTVKRHYVSQGNGNCLGTARLTLLLT